MLPDRSRGIGVDHVGATPIAEPEATAEVSGDHELAVATRHGGGGGRHRHLSGRCTYRRTSLALVVLCTLAVTIGCSSANPDSSSGTGGSNLTTITVALEWTPNTNHSGLFLARDNGWYREAGLNVRIVEPGDSSSLQLLAAGRADVAVSVAEELVPARAEGLPVRSVAAIIEHNTSSLVSLKDAGIERPRDLEGRTYGGWGGQLEEAILHRLIECDGGDPTKLRFVDVGEADYRIGLERGQYDVVWVYDAWDGIRLQQIDKIEMNQISFSDHLDCIPDWYTPLLASSDEMTSKRSSDLRTFLKVTRRGYQAAMDDPSAAAEAVMKAAPDLNRGLVEASAAYLSTRYSESPSAWGLQSEDTWDNFSTFLVDAGLVEGEFDPATAWTNEFLPEP